MDVSMNRIFLTLQTLFQTLVVALMLTACSNLSKNTVKEGKYIVKNGSFGSKQWDDDLVFHRTSWYHELTLQFDLMLVSIAPQSSFNFWFSTVELGDVHKCGDFRVLLAYSLDTKIIPHSMLNEQLEIAGFKKTELSEFKKHLLQHPDSEMNSTKLYQVYGICRESKDLKPLTINFPGFKEKALN